MANATTYSGSTTRKEHNSEPSSENGSSMRQFAYESATTKLTLNIIEITGPDYGEYGDSGLFVWPSGKVLADYVWHIRSELNGKKIIELGGGTALPGMVAAVCGAKVVLTDKEEAPHILQNMELNKHSNNPVSIQQGNETLQKFLDVQICPFTWSHFTRRIVSLAPQDIVLGADCFYDNKKDYDNMLASVSYLMSKNPNLKFITTYQLRSSQRTIESMLARWNMRAKEIPLDSFMSEEKLAVFEEVIHLFEIVQINTNNNI
mmetsp:Transcript_17284/g.19270  ORF Transcript_17284/g.19270 Transcript_17284/m.19270 type:complete len:261 (-) Transcript_17284:6-788(-)